MRYNTILIDGRHLLFRVASTMKGLTVDSTPSGVPIGGVYGFLKTLISIYDDHAAPGALVYVCWEGGAHERRNIQSDYKMGERAKIRAKDEEDPIMATLDDQMRVLMGILTLTGIKQAYSPGWEADDTMGTLAALHEKHDAVPIAIYSGDFDMHQCVTKHTYTVNADRNPHRRGPDQVWDEDAVRERWGGPPRRVIEFKALAGDKGDNYGGCPGIGEVWAKRLMAAYPTLEDVWEAASSGTVSGTYEGKAWESKTVAAKLMAGWGEVETSRKLATINTSAPLKFKKSKHDEEALKRVFSDLSFHSLLRPTALYAIKRLAGLA